MAASLARGSPHVSRLATLRRDVAVCLAAYLYGSAPLIYVLGRGRHVNLKDIGSGNVGAHNLSTVGGIGLGIAGWLFDASKGMLPVAAGRQLGLSDEAAGLAGACGMAGQCWPIFLWFNGGRGISAFVGASYMIDRLSWLVAIAPMIVGGLVRVIPRLGGSTTTVRQRTARSRSVPFGCAIGVVAFPLVYQWRHAHEGITLAPWLLSSAVLLRRLTAPLPDDVIEGPEYERRAWLYRLLFDRNTSY